MKFLLLGKDSQLLTNADTYIYQLLYKKRLRAKENFSFIASIHHFVMKFMGR